MCIVYMTYYTGPRDLKKKFSVPHTEPCLNEVFSIVTCIYRRFDSQSRKIDFFVCRMSFPRSAPQPVVACSMPVTNPGKFY